MEYLKFPMQYLRISQGENTGSHLGTYAMDLAGRDTGKDPVYAPCSGTVVRIRSNANGELYLWSDGDVRCPDGYTGPVTVTLIHDETFNVRQGQHVVQGAHIYDEGGMGHGHPGAYGAHCHMEIVKGHVQPYQTRNAQGSWRTPGQMMHLYDALWIGGDVAILGDGGYPWHRLPAAAGRTYTVKAGDGWWRIAAQQLGSGSLCYKLARANGKTIFSALHPGDVIRLEV